MKRSANGDGDGPAAKHSKKQQKVFNFAAHPKRKIALRFFYYGWQYDGLVMQDSTDNTVEKALRDALYKTKLIECFDTCDFSRCGRTDKGVSAFKQVCALEVRSSTVDDTSFWTPETSEDVRAAYKSAAEDVPYVKMLNGVLPPNIRITAWAKVPRAFSARHACTSRTYKYALPRACYDVQAMRDAVSLLVGRHDFRNFCQVPYHAEKEWCRRLVRNARADGVREIDMNEERVGMTYVREILSADIQCVAKGSSEPSTSTSTPSRYDLLELTIVGTGFLWHQIRFIVGVLHEVGAGHERPEIVSTLLDVDATPRRPVYQMAVDSPLCLFDCRFEREGQEVRWIEAEKAVAEKNLASLQKAWGEAITRARLLENMMVSMVAERPDTEDKAALDMDSGLLAFVQDRQQSANYIPFSRRQTCDSLEEKAAKVLQKKLAKAAAKHQNNESESNGGGGEDSSDCE